MKRIANRVLLLAILLAAACGDGLDRMTSLDKQMSMVAGITVTHGDNQWGLPNTALPTVVRFVVMDGVTPVANARGTIAVTAGGGSVSKGTFRTKANGTAAFTWTLGAAGAQTVTLTLDGSGATAVLNAQVLSPGSATLAITLGNNQTGLPGDTLPVTARVRLTATAGGAPIQGVPVVFSIVDGSGGGLRVASAKTNADGRVFNAWQLGWNKVNQQLVATVAGVGQVTFNATANTAGYAFTIVSGNNQSGTPNTPLASPIIVQLLRNGLPVAGAKGTYQVVSGGGTTSRTAFQTSSVGRNNAIWTLGAAGVQTVKVKIGAIDSLTFNATLPAVVSDFHFQIIYITPPTASQEAAINNAVARWREVITGDLTDQNIVNLTISAGCVASQPVFNAVIDDIVIYVDFSPIDGAFGILGSAGPCYVRNSNFLTSIGMMKFDAADIAMMEADGSFEDVILHEMGHVLGIGTLWANAHGALPAYRNGANTDSVSFRGPNAIAAFDASGGLSFAGPKVPVENCIGIPGCGPGTINGHWRELVMGHELMTGYLSGATRALSLITVRSLVDLGYVVNDAAADPYTVSASLRMPGGPEPRSFEIKEGPPPPVFTIDPVTATPRRIH